MIPVMRGSTLSVGAYKVLVALDDDCMVLF